MRIIFCLFAAWILSLATTAKANEWHAIDAVMLQASENDDIERHRAEPGYFDGIFIEEMRFSERGFDWHLLRFSNGAKPDGPLWIVPHDDENAAFDAMIAGLRAHGGIAIAVSTGRAGNRRQAGNGICGVRRSATTACDPNRNFDSRTPLFTSAILDAWKPGRPIIALHTNGNGFGGDGIGGRGNITLLDQRAYAAGRGKIRRDGYAGRKDIVMLDDADVFAILPYRASSGIAKAEAACRVSLNGSGINVWHERVGRSDGSLSHYIARNRPDIAYANFEAERGADLSVAAEAQRLMIKAYLDGCADLWAGQN